MKIIKPIISEKTLALAHMQNKYTFQVEPKTNKIEIAKEVEQKFGVKVIAVNILNNTGKVLTWGKKRISGRKLDTRKAIVTLKKGNVITEFDIK
jgi:large subunit ribosomal protein L23